VAQAVVLYCFALLCKCKALSSKPQSHKKEKKRKRIQAGQECRGGKNGERGAECRTECGEWI
jgi:hypothetical protein